MMVAVLYIRKALRKGNMPSAVFRGCRHLSFRNYLIAGAEATCVRKFTIKFNH